MRKDEPSAMARTMTWLVVGLATVLISWGIFRYGWSMEIHRRFWTDIFARIYGPMTFRFYLQPAMAAIAALPDGLNDARTRHSSFFWSALWNSNAPTGRLRQGLISTARVVLLGLSIDVIYQFKVLDSFYPGEALMMAVLLALIPYFIFRWIVEHLVRRWSAGKGNGTTI